MRGRIYPDNRRPVEAFGSDGQSMGVYESIMAAADDCLTNFKHVSTCCRCDAPPGTCRQCSLFQRHWMTFRWAAKSVPARKKKTKQ